MPKQVKKSLVISIYLALTVSTLLVFWQVRNFDFVNYDDDVYVSANQHVAGGLTLDNIKWAFTANVSSHWHPLTWLSLMLDCQLFGANAGRIHLVNLFLHIVNTLLLFMVLKKMTGSLWPSAFVAAAFALHPMHVESVAWIAERKDVLSTLFWFLTMGAYLAYVRRPGAFRYTVTLVLFALGLMTKPMLVTLPFVLLLFDYWPLERISRFQWKIFYRLVLEKIPFFALVAVSSVVTFLAMRSGGTLIKADTLPLNSRIANAVLSYVRYLYKMVWPQDLAVFYPFDIGGSPFWQVAACALLLGGISIFVIFRGRKQRYLPVGWFWFVGTLVPVIGFVQVGKQAFADRYTYISYIGLFIMLAWGLPQLLSKWISALPQRKFALGASMVLVLTTLGICAHRQTSYWKNSETLLSHAIEVTQNNWPAYYNLGNARYALGRYPEAIEAFRQAIRIDPDCAEAYYNLGIVYDDIGRYAEAIDAYKQAIRIKPDDPEAHCRLGYSYLAIGNKNSALAELNILKSLNSELANNLLNQINK